MNDLNRGEFRDKEVFSNFKELAIFLWKKRKWIVASTFVTTLLGIIYALVASPVFKSIAIIAPKETQGSAASSSLLSQIGGLGGLISSQLGGSSVDHLETVIRSHDLAEKVIIDNNLLPMLFPKKWDAGKGRWKKPKDTPTVLGGVKVLMKSHLSAVASNKKKTVSLSILFSDSVFSKKLADNYLTALSGLIKERALKESEINRAYLEEQMSKTSDPLIRSKIQELIGIEIEKSMIMSSRGFDILESPGYPLDKLKPKRRLIVEFAFLFGIIMSMMAIVALEKSGIRFQRRK